MNRKKIYSAILALLAVNMVYGQMAQDRMHYIAKFSKIAQEEMERTGVPASIKLAQAILESNGGKSVLSRKANNHFGIKCGGSWNDRSFYRVDDEKDSKGNDIESCFRVYKSAESSFVAHSEFLRNNKRYESLFSLAHDDYKGWAHGLKKAGYATNPKYPTLLIKVVENYSLFQYDDLFVPADDVMLATTEEDVYFEELARREKEQTAKVTKTGKLNDIDVIFADAHETPEIIAAKTDVSLRRLFKYNDILTDPEQDLPENSIVFLQPKRKAFRGRKKFHKVSEGETIAQISQKYGIRIDKLLSRNRLSTTEEPLAGAILKIKGRKVASNSRIPTREVGVASNSSEGSKKQDPKFATALSDFELPPSVEEERKQDKKRKKLSFNTNKQMQEEAEESAPIVNRIEQSTTSTSGYLEESKQDNSVYRAPITSNNYNTYDSSSNAKFKEEKVVTQTTTVRPSEPVRTDVNNGSYNQSTTSTTVITSPTTSNNTVISNSTVSSSPAVTSPTVTSPSVSNPTVTSTNSSSVISTPAPATSTQAVETRYHTVEKGQTLYRLSKIYSKPVDYIKQVNGLSSNTISIGQKLIVN